MQEYEVRAYQQEAIASCVEGFTARGHNSLLLESPVGSGKTYMALEVIHRLQAALGRHLKVNWVAPRHRLLQQMMVANRDLYQDEIHPVSLFASEPPEADLVVLDEAHHEATQSCVMLYEKMRSTWTLGLSATPMRTDRMKLSFQESIRTCSIARLIREGFLSPFNSYLISKYDVETVADFYLAEPEKWGKSLVFFTTIAECEAFKERLRAGGVACEVVTGKSDKDIQMEMFESGRVPVIANVAMLTEGFDQPDVQSVFARDASRLPTIQMCGRGLRLAAGKDACNIVQSVDSPYLFERVASAKNAYRWRSGHWLALKDGTEAIESTIQETLRRISLRQDRDEKTRKNEYRAVAKTAPGRFKRKLTRLAEKEENERSYYSEFGGVYAALQEFYERVNKACWGGVLKPCAFHLNKKNAWGSGMVSILPGFVQDEDRELNVPAISVNVRQCPFRLTARSFSVELVRAMVSLYLLQMGRPSTPETCSAELFRLGYSEERKAYQKDSLFAAVAQAADLILAPFVVRKLHPALWHVYKNTAKGDVQYYLSELPQVAVRHVGT